MIQTDLVMEFLALAAGEVLPFGGVGTLFVMKTVVALERKAAQTADRVLS